MRELALHILDLIENCIRAGADTVEIGAAAEPACDTLTFTVDDNGPGFSVPPAAVMDPFYTTKQGKRVGLGLSLFRAACEQAGGTLTIGRSPLGGARVSARMSLSHVDRQPLGDLPGTLASVAWANSGIAFRFNIRRGGESCTVDVREVAQELGASGSGEASVARLVEKRLSQACSFLEQVGTQYARFKGGAKGDVT